MNTHLSKSTAYRCIRVLIVCSLPFTLLSTLAEESSARPGRRGPPRGTVAIDLCPDDPTKRLPRRCGCGVADIPGGCDVVSPISGLRSYQMTSQLSVREAVIPVASGNLNIRKELLSLKTAIGDQSINGAYNSTTGLWTWNFDLSYDGNYFVDPSGARLSTWSVPFGYDIPGTTWIKESRESIRTLGGLVYNFDEDHMLSSIHWLERPYPQLTFVRSINAQGGRHIEVVEKTEETSSETVFTIDFDLLDQTSIFGRRVTGAQATITDRAGRQASFTFDPLTGLVRSIKDGLETDERLSGSTFEYRDFPGDWTMLSAAINSEGERVEYEYHPLRRQVTNVRRIGEGSDSLDYHLSYLSPTQTEDRYQTIVTFPDEGELEYKYDSLGRITSAKNLFDEEETHNYELHPNHWFTYMPAEHVDTKGNRTIWDNRYDRIHNGGRPVEFLVTSSFIHAGETSPRELPVTSRYQHTPYTRRLTTLINQLDPASRPLMGSYNDDGMVQSPEYRDGILTEAPDFGENSAHEIYEKRKADYAFGAEAPGYRREISPEDFYDDVQYDRAGNPVYGSDRSAPFAQRPGVNRLAYNGGRYLNRVDLVSSSLNAGMQNTSASDKIHISYRSDGQVRFIERPFGGHTRFTYDEYGRKIERAECVGGSNVTIDPLCQGSWQRTRFEYDSGSRVTAVQQENGMRTVRRYDSIGREVFIANGFVRSFGRMGARRGRPRGFRTRFLPQKQVWKTYEGRNLIRICDSTDGCINNSGPQELRTHDDEGRVTRVDFPDGERLELDFSESVIHAGGISARKSYYGENGLPVRTVFFEYDAKGKLVEMRNGPADKLWSGESFNMDYGNGLQRSATLGTYRITRFKTCRGYRCTGELAGPAGFYLEKTRTLGPENATGSGVAREILEDRSYSYDSDLDGHSNEDDNCPARYNPGQEDVDGNQVGDVCEGNQGLVFPSNPLETMVITDNADCKENGNGSCAVEQFSIASGRLWNTGSPQSGGNRMVGSGFENSAREETYEYDVLGNLTRVSGRRNLVLTYNNTRNRLESVVGTLADGRYVNVDYVYDNAGYLISRGNISYVWSGAGNITQIGNDDFAWDGLGRVRSRRLGTESVGYSHGGRVEVNELGQAIAIDTKHIRLALNGTEEHLYRHYDFRGNLQFTSNAQGDVVRTEQYSGYGPSTAPALGTIGFAGGRQYTEFVSHVGVRLYDALSGRFISNDPIHQWMNQYQYADGNPIYFEDLSGRETAGWSWDTSPTPSQQRNEVPGGKQASDQRPQGYDHGYGKSFSTVSLGHGFYTNVVGFTSNVGMNLSFVGLNATGFLGGTLSAGVGYTVTLESMSGKVLDVFTGETGVGAGHGVNFGGTYTWGGAEGGTQTVDSDIDLNYRGNAFELRSGPGGIPRFHNPPSRMNPPSPAPPPPAPPSSPAPAPAPETETVPSGVPLGPIF